MNDLMELPTDLATEPQDAVSWARSLAIVSPAQLTEASDRLKGIKALGKRIADWFGPMKAKAAAAHKEICAREKEMLDPLKDAEIIVKDRMLGYQREEEEKRLAEERRLQDAENERKRREREKLEQEAAKQRAAEAEAKAKAEKARREAEQADAAERKRLLAQAEANDRKAAAASAKAESKEEQSINTVATTIRVPPTAVAPAGTSTRKIWKAKITDLAAFFAYVHETKRNDLILPNEKTLDALAKALKEQANIPGVSFICESQMAIRS